jgi:predicted metalloprotease
MRWKRSSRDDRGVVDVRGRSGGMSGGRVALPGGLGLVGVLVFVAFQLLSGSSGFAVPSAFDDGTQAPGGGAIPAGQDPERDLRDFSEYVFDSTQRTWARTIGSGYRDAKLYLYRGAVNTGCGSASSAVGPFYCPADERVYLDHHVQHLRGTDDDVRRLQREDPDEANALSVRLELQADCYAGVWASTVFDQLDPGDLEEAVTASEAVGDDRLQRRARGEVDPDSFTHGTSEQRSHWFEVGRAAGRPADCDTFSADEL